MVSLHKRMKTTGNTLGSGDERSSYRDKQKTSKTAYGTFDSYVVTTPRYGAHGFKVTRFAVADQNFHRISLVYAPKIALEAF